MNTVALRRSGDVFQRGLMISLAAMYGTIIVGWIAYEQYQPKLLLQFNFTEFTFALTVAQAIILVVIPPLAGRIADRYRVSKGHQFPVISLGISFAAMVFMAVAFTLLSNPGEIFKWLLPVLIILWLVAMSIFTGPALSTMDNFIPAGKLPRAMALLTITGNLLYSLEPVIVDIIDYIGAPVTFMAGGILVFSTGVILKRNMFASLHNNDGDETQTTSVLYVATLPSRYIYIFMTGGVYGLMTALLFQIFPDSLVNTLGHLPYLADGKLMVVFVLILSAVLSLPVSSLVSRYGLTPSFLISLLIAQVGIFGILLSSSAFVVVASLACFALGLTVLSVSALPLAIESSGQVNKVFSVCIFFAGAALPDGLLEVVTSI